MAGHTVCSYCGGTGRDLDGHPCRHCENGRFPDCPDCQGRGVFTGLRNGEVVSYSCVRCVEKGYYEL